MADDEHQRTDGERLSTLVRQLDETQAIAHIGTFAYDVDADLVTWSAELYRIFGLEPQGEAQQRGAFYFTRVHPDDLPEVNATLAPLFEHGGSARFAHRILRESGEERMVECTATATRDSGDRMLIVGTTYDVTDERHLADAYAREREAARHLVELDALRSVFLTAVSHELRTPLTAILGFAITLDERAGEFDRASVDASIRVIRGQAERLTRLLEDLLDLDWLRHGTIEPARTLVSVPELVERSIEATETQDREVVLDIADPFDAMLDGPKVERIVANLVGNAVKYSPAAASVRVRAWREDDGVHIAVEDQGPGIPAALREEVFEPFQRLEAGADIRGSGIGLSLVRAFARLHGGDAWVEPGDDGTGSTFRVRLGEAVDAA